jgi:ribose/xylose/arabinose/galactoside ABC-type transport system permease subunit
VIKIKKLLTNVVTSRTSFLISLLLFIIIILSFSSPYFLSISNLLEITQFGAVLAIVALGEALIILSGNEGIDLSVGAILSLSGVLFGLAINNGFSMGAAIIITILSGILLGCINGILIAYIGIPPLIGTLGTMYIYSSLALYLTGGTPISGFPEYFKILGQKNTLGIPNQVLFVAVPIFIFTYFIIKRTSFGRKVYLVGTNDVAARLATINTPKVRMALYAYSGFLASIASIIMCSWLMTARADVGNGLELQAVTVSVLGGINIKGGEGNLSGVMLAVLIITITSSGLQIANVNSIWQLAILGFILIFAVLLNQYIVDKKVA